MSDGVGKIRLYKPGEHRDFHSDDAKQAVEDGWVDHPVSKTEPDKPVSQNPPQSAPLGMPHRPSTIDSTQT